MANSNGINRTENDILFDAEVNLLLGFESDDIRRKMNAFRLDYIVNKGVEYNNNFSKDNWIGVYCWHRRFNPDQIKDLPLFGHHALNPFDFAFFYSMKHWFFRSFFKLMVHFACLHSCKRPANETSGKILAYFQARALGMNKTIKKMDKLISDMYIDSWDGVFNIYFKKDHHVSKAYHASKM